MFSYNNEISGNIALDNLYGIDIYESYENIISENITNNNTFTGIYSGYNSENDIFDDIANNN